MDIDELQVKIRFDGDTVEKKIRKMQYKLTQLVLELEDCLSHAPILPSGGAMNDEKGFMSWELKQAYPPALRPMIEPPPPTPDERNQNPHKPTKTKPKSPTRTKGGK